jgi:hypothetical protein
MFRLVLVWLLELEKELTDIPDLRVLHDELVHGDGGDPEENAGEDHGDYSWNPA